MSVFRKPYWISVLFILLNELAAVICQGQLYADALTCGLPFSESCLQFRLMLGNAALFICIFQTHGPLKDTHFMTMKSILKTE